MAEEKLSLGRRLLEIQKAVAYLQKENKSFSYKYVSNTQTVAAVRKEMDKYGVLLVPGMPSQEVMVNTYEKYDKDSKQNKTVVDYFTKVSMTFTWMNADDLNDKLECPWQAQGVDNAEKGIGKAATYAEKYFILKFFHIATDVDDPDAWKKENDYDEPAAAPAPRATTTNITLDQKRRLGELAVAKGLSKEDANKRMKDVTGKTVMNELTREEGDRLIANFESLADVKQGAVSH